MNITFVGGVKCNIVCDYDTKIKDVLDKFSNRVGKPKDKYRFLFKGDKLDKNDERKIENILTNVNCEHIIITAIELGI